MTVLLVDWFFLVVRHIYLIQLRTIPNTLLMRCCTVHLRVASTEMAKFACHNISEHIEVIWFISIALFTVVCHGFNYLIYLLNLFRIVILQHKSLHCFYSMFFFVLYNDFFFVRLTLDVRTTLLDTPDFISLLVQCFIYFVLIRFSSCIIFFRSIPCYSVYPLLWCEFDCLFRLLHYCPLKYHFPGMIHTLYAVMAIVLVSM